jgi:hypothetical protein
MDRYRSAYLVGFVIVNVVVVGDSFDIRILILLAFKCPAIRDL